MSSKISDVIIPLFHAFITSYYSNYLMFYDKNFFNISLYEIEDVHHYYLTTPIYSYIYLFFHIKSALKDNIPIKIHACMFSLISILSIIYKKQPYFTVGLIIETSTILLKIMYVYKHFYLKVIFFITFFIYRGLLLPYICYVFINNHYQEILNIYNIHFLYFLISLTSNGLNLYWLGLMIHKLYKLFYYQENIKI